jgi:hypothetical protein
MRERVDRDADFDCPMALLELPRDAYARLSASEAVRAYYPGLEGGRVLGVHFNFDFAQWEILYTHPTFPLVPPGGTIRRFRPGDAEVSGYTQPDTVVGGQAVEDADWR